MQAYNKAIMSILGGAVTLAGLFGLDVGFLSPEVLSGVGVVLGTVLVYVVPNKPA